MQNIEELTPEKLEKLRNRLPTDEELKATTEFIRSFGPVEFKPCAYYLMREVHVQRKDCSYTSEFINHWFNLHRENYRSWWKPWRHYVGFSVYCPKELGLTGAVTVQDVLSRVKVHAPMVFGRREKLLRRLAGDLTVKLEELA